MSLQFVPRLSFDFFASRPVEVELSSSPLSSDAGLLPIRQFDERIRLTEQFAAALEDRRHPTFIEHSLLTMVRQRIYGSWPTTRIRTTTTRCGLTRMAVPEPVSLCLHVTYAQVQTNNLGVSLNALS